jgi:hypothetical protein
MIIGPEPGPSYSAVVSEPIEHDTIHASGIVHHMTDLGCAGLSGSVRSPLRRSTEALQGAAASEKCSLAQSFNHVSSCLGPDQVKHSL